MIPAVNWENRLQSLKNFLFLFRQNLSPGDSFGAQILSLIRCNFQASNYGKKEHKETAMQTWPYTDKYAQHKDWKMASFSFLIYCVYFIVP